MSLHDNPISIGQHEPLAIEQAILIDQWDLDFKKSGDLS